MFEGATLLITLVEQDHLESGFRQIFRDRY